MFISCKKILSKLWPMWVFYSYALLVNVMLFFPAGQSRKIVGVSSFLSRHVLFVDKLIHFFLFFCLYLFVELTHTRVSAPRVLLFVMGWGALSEVLQGLFPFLQRTADVWDFLADVCGALCAYYIFTVYPSYKHR